MKKHSTMFLCLALLVGACAPKANPVIVIFPDNCKLFPGETLPVSLKSSNVPPGTEVTWSATDGSVNPTIGSSVVYTAPQQPGTVIITAIFVVDGKPYSDVLTCEVTVESSPAALTVVSPIEAPADTTSIPRPEFDLNKIAITEVMPNPCGSQGFGPERNEYIELYNYGSVGIDVGGWWIATRGGGDGTPDKIVPWNVANPGKSLGTGVLANDSIIPPAGFAVILAPEYYNGEGKYHMPYAFPAGTIILSFSTSKYLGNDSTGLVGGKTPLTTIVLYQGTDNIISHAISTYGSPNYGSTPDNVEDDKLDSFPYPLSACRSMERINASGPDQTSNWREIDAGNPGKGNYVP